MMVLIGQVIIGLVFVIAAIGDIFDYKFLLGLLESKRIPYREYLLPGAIALKIVCGLGLVFNILVPVAAFLLAGFTLIANIIFHNFWMAKGVERKQSYLQFLVHLAVVGGLIVLAGH